MTRISPEFGGVMEVEAILPVSADVNFAAKCFPKYRIGPDNQIYDDVALKATGPSLKEVVEHESEQLYAQNQRLSVRDMASKFDKNVAAAAKLADEAKLKEVPSLEGHVLLKKVRDALESLKGRLSGRNKEDVQKAISMVEALAVQLTQREGELIQEKFEVKKLTNFLKQASEDAKRLVNQEKSFACAEIESARAVVQRFWEALAEEERNSQKSGKQDTKKLLEEVQEGRRIRMMHQPTKVMDMEHELRELRIQIREKSIFSVKLQKELAISKRAEEKRFNLFEIEGSETLGSQLQIRPCSDNAPELSESTIQWYRVSVDGSKREPISGANRLIYAPEPLDVGKMLQAEVNSNGRKVTVTTDAQIEQASGLDSYVETLQRKSNADFNVVVSQINGQDHQSNSGHVLHIGKMRMKLSKGWITRARESYSSSMQLCGARGGGNAASKALFWQARKGHSFVLTFESERERNAAIILARKYALDSNVILAGPDDRL
uniref:Uncharacterized protein n=1 Tax=Kalanchoe fedtschenkoi TaxID=63787 RepID=A0A7N0V202_KALFE